MLALLLPTLHLGLLSDDFYLLAERQGHGPFGAADAMHRPLRNFLYYAFYRGFGFWSLPYRVWVLSMFGLLLWQMYGLLRDLGIAPLAAALAWLPLAFLPRLSEIIFWLGGSQDVVVGLCTVAVVRCVLLYRRRPGWQPLLGAVFCYAFAMGFKETGGLIPLFALLIECGRARDWKLRLNLPFLGPYLAMLPVALGFAVYYLAGHAVAQVGGHHPSSAYGYHGVALSAGAFVRDLVLIFNVTAPAFSLRHPQWGGVAVFAVCCIGLAASSLRFRAGRFATCCALWIVLSLLPTAVLSPFYAGDRYLFLAYLGLTLWFGFVLNKALRAFETPRMRMGLAVCFAVLAFFMASHLFAIRSLWERAADVTWNALWQIQKLTPGAGPGSVISIVDLPHSYTGADGHGAYELNNGFRGALLGFGYPESTRVLYTFDTAQDELSRALRTGLDGCAAQPDHPVEPACRAAVSRLTDPCSTRTVRQSQISDAQLWWGDREGH